MTDRENVETFRSNAEMARHYFKEFLADGWEHSAQEIGAYIFDKTGGRGVNGKRLTDETIHSAIWYMFRHDHDFSYMQSRKGFYQKTPLSVLTGNGPNSLRAAAVRILSEAVEDIREQSLLPGLHGQEQTVLDALLREITAVIDVAVQAIGAGGPEQTAMTEDTLAIDSELFIEGDHVNAYLAIWFDVDKRLGLQTDGTDEFVNLYADYYPADGRLDVFYIHRGPDAEIINEKPVDDITAEEKELILRLMKDAGLDECVAEMSEEQKTDIGMNMKGM